MERMFHTPEGVRDVYNGECEQKLVLEERYIYSAQKLWVSGHRNTHL